MSTIEAIYENGVFKPVDPVSLPDKERVRLRIEIVATEGSTWIAQMRQARDRLQNKYGTFPDSSKDIAEDRRRDA